MIDVSRVGEAAVEKVASTEVAKQTIKQDMSGVERLAGADIELAEFHGST